MKGSCDAPGTRTLKVAFVLVPRFNMMTLTAAIEPMRVANYLSSETLFEWEYRSAQGGEIVASNGMTIGSGPIEAPGSAFDIVVLCGSWGCEHLSCPTLFKWLRRQTGNGVTLVALESGAFLLARAGLLHNRLATTHWSILAGFAEQFPDTPVHEQLFTADEPVMTCAGGTASLDLVLHLIAERFGPQLASEIADQVLHHPVRNGEAPQRHTMGAATDELHPDVKAAIALIEEHVDEPWPVPKIAAHLRVSQRQIERLFQRHLGCSVVQFSQLLRLQYARVLLTSTRMSIREVSVACGFNSLSYFSQAFARCFGRKPSDYRQAWPETDPAPSWPGTLFSFVERTRLARGRRGRPTDAGRVIMDRAEWP